MSMTACGDESGPRGAEPTPELPEVFLLAAWHDIEQFGTARPFQGADHGPVGLASAHGDLIDSQDRDAVQGPLSLDFFQSPLVDGLDRGPMQQHQSSRGLDGHDLAQLVDQGGQRTRDHGTIRRKGQQLQVQAALRATNPEAAHAQEGRILPQRQMLDLDPPTGMSSFQLVLTFPTLVALPEPFEFPYYNLPPTAGFHRQLSNTIPLDSEQFSEIMKLHRVGPPVCPLGDEQREYTLPDALLYRNLHKNPS